jgi:uncharacterized protein VirK/YbjX
MGVVPAKVGEVGAVVRGGERAVRWRTPWPGPALRRAWIVACKAGWAAVVVLTHLQLLLSVRLSDRTSVLGRLIRSRPEIWTMVLSPFVAASWDIKTRFARIMEHCEIVQRLGPPFDLGPDEGCELARIDDAGVYRIVMHRSGIALRDGLLAISLIGEDERLFSLVFSLGYQGGKICAYIGAIQGCALEDVLQRYKEFSKLVDRMRPRDFLVEVFKMMADALDLETILAVSDIGRHQKSAYLKFGDANYDKVKLNYDQTWIERGGVQITDDFFSLPIGLSVRASDQIPPRKRAMYRRRYEALAALAPLFEQRLAPAKSRLYGTSVGAG